MKLRNKLFSVTTIIVIIAVVITAFSTVRAMYSAFEKAVANELLMTLRLVDGNEEYAEEMDWGSRRFTCISSDGTVVYDSQADSEMMENHLKRPEVQMALSRMVGFDVRESSTLLENMFYVAILSSDGNVIRLSESQSSIYSFIFTSIPYVTAIILLVIIASLLVSNRISEKAIEPINRIDLDNPMEAEGLYEELSPLVRKIDEQNSRIKSQIELLKRDRDELNLIVKSMKDGLIIIRSNGDVLMMNDAAKTMMGKNTNEEFKSLIELSREGLFFSIIEKGSAGGRINVEGRTIEVHAEVVEGLGSAILLFDVSDKLALEMKEREFIQNVSHELKTPLTSISGYSELIMRDQVDKDHIKEFSTQIYNEARRLYQLIEDIMAISRLDEEAEVTLQDIDVNLIAKDVLDSIANPIVSLKEDSRLRIKGNGTLVFEAIYNLVDNAIKYNRNDNPVTLEIGSNYFAVEDHGIGLSPYDKERVFDRFYRVDKSRSRKTGGTGLGLSIVKSVAERHGARIEINSTLGSGTTIKIVFPPKQFK